jgi:signal transduction histidine kinase
MYRFVCLLLLVLISGSDAWAQNEFAVRQYGTENGMPSNGIKGMQWDEETGFLWIATEAGVARFNGVDFKNFTKENIPELYSERMLFLVRNQAGVIYTSDQDRNLFKVQKNRLTFDKHYGPKEGKAPNMFLVAVSDALLRHNLYRENPRPYNLPFDRVVHLTDTSCFINQRRSLYYYSVSQEREISFPNARDGVRTVFKIDTSYFVKDGSNQLFRLNTVTETLAPVVIRDENGRPLDPLPQESIIYWTNGMSHPLLFMGSKAWLLTAGTNNELRLQLVATNVPANSFIRFAQYSERQKLLFIATDSKGIIVVSQNRVTPVKKQTNGRNERNAYYGQLELSNGTILTNEGHIIGKSNTPVRSLPISGPFVSSVFKTGDSLLWYCKPEETRTTNWLYCYNEKTGQTKIYDKTMLNGLHGLAYSNHKVYLAHYDGFGFLDGDTIKYIFPKKQWGFNSYDIQEVEPGILFLATCDALLRFNTVSQKLDTLFSEKGYCVRSIWKYKDYVFFTTYGKGFYVWKKGRVKAMPLDKNKYLLYAHCFMPDDAGYCWISTNRGLFKASIDELVNAYERSPDHVYYHYFGKNDGMEITEMNGGCTPCALRLRNGTFSFPTMDGLLWVDPKKATPVLPIGSIYIDEFVVDDKALNVDSIGRRPLPSATSDVTVKVGYAAWCNKENIYIEYQLNDDTNWKSLDVGNEAVIRYNNLSSGDYVLRLRKLNGFGVNNYTNATIRFSITTPWYQRWWFYVVAGLVAAGIIHSYFRLRIHRHEQLQKKLERQVAEKTKELQEKNEVLEKANSIKTRLISIISHDIITPLKFVTGAGKNLLEKRQQMPEDLQEEALQEITHTAQELHLLSTNILNWIKYQNEHRRLAKEEFNVCEMVDSVFGVLRSVANQKQLQLVNKVDKELVISQYYEPLKILVYNLVSNAIRFSDLGTVVVSDRVGTNEVTLCVKDEGVGMTKDQVANILSNHFIVSSAHVDSRKGNGLGYLIIKDLVKMTGASLEIKSEKGVGTEVMVHIPAQKL